MAKRKKLTKRQLSKLRSEAAKRGWITRRKRVEAKSVGTLGAALVAHAAEVELRQKAARDARKQYLERYFQDVSAAATSPEDEAEILRKRVEFLEDILARQEGIREQAELIHNVQELAATDPELLEASWSQEIQEAWERNPKKVPEVIRELWENIVEWDLAGDYDEGDLWELYHEAG